MGEYGGPAIRTVRIIVVITYVVVVHACQITPAAVASDFDEACPQHDAEYEPPVAPHHDDRRGTVSKW